MRSSRFSLCGILKRPPFTCSSIVLICCEFLLFGSLDCVFGTPLLSCAMLLSQSAVSSQITQIDHHASLARRNSLESRIDNNVFTFSTVWCKLYCQRRPEHLPTFFTFFFKCLFMWRRCPMPDLVSGIRSLVPISYIFGCNWFVSQICLQQNLRDNKKGMMIKQDDEPLSYEPGSSRNDVGKDSYVGNIELYVPMWNEHK